MKVTYIKQNWMYIY